RRPSIWPIRQENQPISPRFRSRSEPSASPSRATRSGCGQRLQGGRRALWSARGSTGDIVAPARALHPCHPMKRLVLVALVLLGSCRALVVRDKNFVPGEDASDEEASIGGSAGAPDNDASIDIAPEVASDVSSELDVGCKPMSSCPVG